MARTTTEERLAEMRRQLDALEERARASQGETRREVERAIDEVAFYLDSAHDRFVEKVAGAAGAVDDKLFTGGQPWSDDQRSAEPR
jgi:hypothetical protein